MRLAVIPLILLLFIGNSFVIDDRFQKTVTVSVNDKPDITIDGVTVYMDNLAREMQQRLWRSYMTGGKMVQSIFLDFSNGVTEETKKEVLFNVKTAQEKTLTVLSLHKYKKRFENIGSSKQERLRKNFPVLFQRDYPSN